MISVEERKKRFESSMVSQDFSVKEVMAQIDRSGFKTSFIVDGNKKLLGVVTDGDIRRFLLKGGSSESKINEVMNTSFYSVKSKNEIDSARVGDLAVTALPQINNEGQLIDFFVFSYDTKEFLSYLNDSIQERPINKVLVVGGAGYLGSILCKKLLGKGYSVRVLDSLLFGDESIKDLTDNPQFELIVGDMRDISVVMQSVEGVDAVVHLAAIVGDPASALNPAKTIEVNYLATKLIADVCKYSQINKFIFASTCSVYGAQLPEDEGFLTEESSLNPVSLYAEMKIMSEKALMEMRDRNFAPTILRMGTLYGLSPRMRFDLVVNILTAKAKFDGEFTIMGGDQWRPFVEVGDAADAYVKCIEAPFEKVGGESFNVGGDKQNMMIKEVGDLVKNLIPTAKLNTNKTDVDRRDYKVSFKKITDILDYIPKKSMEESIKEMEAAIDSKKIVDYTLKIYNNYHHLKNEAE